MGLILGKRADGVSVRLSNGFSPQNLRDGWGPVEEMMAAVSALKRGGIPALEAVDVVDPWREAWARDGGVGWVRLAACEVEFRSPFAGQLAVLGADAGVARVRCRALAPLEWLPRLRAGQARGAALGLGFAAGDAVVYNIPQFGAEGFPWREWMFSDLPARHGVAVVLSENAFFGSRRPRERADDPGVRIRTAAEILAMGAAAQTEAASVLQGLHACGLRRLCVAGVSFGACMSVGVAGLCSAPVACAALMPAASAAAVFVPPGTFASTVDFSALDPARLRATSDDDSVLVAPAGAACACTTATPLAACPATAAAGGAGRCWRHRGFARYPERAGQPPLTPSQEALSAALACTDLRRQPPPMVPEACVVWAADDDGYIPFASARAAAAHFGPDADFRSVTGGHVSAFLVHNASFRQAVLDAIRRLDAALQRPADTAAARL